MGLRNVEPTEHQLPSGAIIIDLVTTPEKFDALETAWNALLARSRCEPACLHWKWMQLWWKHFAQADFKLHVLLFHHANELVGIFPLVMIPLKGRVSREQVLYFLGTGENEFEEITTEYIDILVLPGFEQIVAEAAVRYFTQTNTQWDRMELMRYEKNSVLQQYFFPTLQAAGIRQYRALSGFRHFLPLETNYDTYLSKRSRSFRRTIRNHGNRLNELGHLEIHAITSADQIDDALHALRQLHLHRFESLTATSAFISQRFTDYHRELMHWLFKHNRLLFLMYVLDGKIITAEYNFIFGKTVYAYQGSFDPDIKRLSPGFLSINEVINLSIQQGADIFDFMMGGEDHYASSYGCEREAIHTCYAFNRSIRCRLTYYGLVSKQAVKEVLVVLKEVWSLVKLMV